MALSMYLQAHKNKMNSQGYLYSRKERFWQNDGRIGTKLTMRGTIGRSLCKT